MLQMCICGVRIWHIQLKFLLKLKHRLNKNTFHINCIVQTNIYMKGYFILENYPENNYLINNLVSFDFMYMMLNLWLFNCIRSTTLCWQKVLTTWWINVYWVCVCASGWVVVRIVSMSTWSSAVSCNIS